MGSAIIDAIKSGLGLVGDLATEFLNGFTALVWVPGSGSTAGHLTEFAEFSLIMLAISVTFGCITMVISLVRGNTGA